MRICRSIAEIRPVVAAARVAGTIGFVPTMGALHEGHLSLARAARVQTDTVVLSIFVNPLQFGPGEDLATYPRTEVRDLELARDVGVDVVFAPSIEEMYGTAHATAVTVGGPAQGLEGAARPGHFSGVATVVAKLFNVVRPNKAFFGQKDAQQCAVVKRMVADLSFDLEIVVCPTVREADGVAMSSRNRYLSDGERRRAAVLYRALTAGRRVLEEGGDVRAAESEMERVFAGETGVFCEYARAVDPDTFGAARAGGPVLLAVAARVGPVRLVDNLPIGPPDADIVG